MYLQGILNLHALRQVLKIMHVNKLSSKVAMKVRAFWQHSRICSNKHVIVIGHDFFFFLFRTPQPPLCVWADRTLHMLMLQLLTWQSNLLTGSKSNLPDWLLDLNNYYVVLRVALFITFSSSVRLYTFSSLTLLLNVYIYVYINTCHQRTQ